MSSLIWLWLLIRGAAASSARWPMVLGIDLGDHSSVLATVTGRTGVEIVANDVSGRTIPRCVTRARALSLPAHERSRARANARLRHPGRRAA